jgi:hypothetical protein
MTSDEKKRDAASEALISLRKAMGKTQQTFAVEVLKTAIGTVARYETSDPPRGEVLLRLRDIARNHEFHELAIKFELLYLDGVQKNLGSRLILIPATESEPAHGYLNVALPSAAALAGARVFIGLLDQLDDPNEEVRSDAASALLALRAAWQKHQDPGLRDLHDRFEALVARDPRTAKKSSNPGKKG